jgi:hypothetical protein
MTLDQARVGVSVVAAGLYVNNAKVVSGGTTADNGLVYAIDTVLMPPDPSALGSARVGYCAVAGNTLPSGAPVRPGRFLNLRDGTCGTANRRRTSTTRELLSRTTSREWESPA